MFNNDLHIAFISLPHSPHVYPTLPIVSALARRGYHVTYVTSDRFSSAAEDSGAEVILCPRLMLHSPIAKASDESDMPGDAITRHAQETLEIITKFYGRHRPALILYDFMALAGRILASRWAIPSVQTSPFYALEESRFTDQVNHEAFRNVLLEHGAAVTRYLLQQGVTSSNYRTDKEKLNIYLFPRALQPNSAIFGDDCFFAGRCAAERLPARSWPFDWDRRPIVLVAMSTLFAAFTGGAKIPIHFKICIDAFADLGWRVVLCVGEGCDPTELMPLPTYCEIISHTAYSAFISRASLLIYMSGIISTAEAAYCGVPMIAISQGVNEYEWQADHLETLGIGAHIRKVELNAENLRRVALHITQDPQTQRRLREVRRNVRREPGAEDAANRIEDYLDCCFAAGRLDNDVLGSPEKSSSPD